jgi:hypothetical protein
MTRLGLLDQETEHIGTNMCVDIVCVCMIVLLMVVTYYRLADFYECWRACRYRTPACHSGHCVAALLVATANDLMSISPRCTATGAGVHKAYAPCLASSNSIRV